MKLHWENAEDLGLALHEKYPEVNPLQLRFTELHKLVCALEEFDDQPEASTEGKLEAIQMAWYEEIDQAG